MTGPCPGGRETVSLAFANTSDEGLSDAPEAARTLQAWLVEHRLLRADVHITGAELSRFALLREAIRGVLAARVAGAEPDGSAVRVVEAAALAAPGVPIGVWGAGGVVTRGWRPTGGDPLDRAAAALAADVVDVVCDLGDRLTGGTAHGGFRVSSA